MSEPDQLHVLRACVELGAVCVEWNPDGELLVRVIMPAGVPRATAEESEAPGERDSFQERDKAETDDNDEMRLALAGTGEGG